MSQKKKNKNKIIGFKGKELFSKVEEKETIEFNDINENMDIRNITVGEVEVSTDVNVVLTKEVHRKINTLTKLIDKEITGLGLVKMEGDVAKVYELFLLKQEVTGGSCEIDEVAICELVDKLIADGKNPEDLKFWWHSHANMGVFWSNTDENTGLKFGGNSFFLSLVSNHKGEMKAKINVYKPIPIILDDLSISVEEEEIVDNTFVENLKIEITEKVSTKTYPRANNNYNNYGAWSGRDRWTKENDEKTEEEIIADALKQEDEQPIDRREASDSYFDFFYCGIEFIYSRFTQGYTYRDSGSKTPLSQFEVENVTGKCTVDIIIDHIRSLKNNKNKAQITT